MKAFNLSLVLFILALAFVSPQGSGFAQSGDERTQSTAHYRIALDIGPVAMPMLAMTDRERPVNRHIEVAVYDQATGARLRRAMPRITITDRRTGRATALQAVTAMYDGTEGPNDSHFGGNVHLADGTYRIAVTVGGERAVFKRVAVGRP